MITPRERVLKMFRGERADRPAVQYLYVPVGLYEHGEKLNDLFEKYPGDFERFVRQPIPQPPDGTIDREGRYYEKQTDEWGVTQEYRVFGIMGHAIGFPIKTIGDAAHYSFPPLPDYFINPAQMAEDIAHHKKEYVSLGGGMPGLMQKLWHLRGFENTMMDMHDDSAEFNALMDRLADYERTMVAALVAADVDVICYGDDYGVQEGLMFSKELFRHSIKPRLARIFEPAVKTGKYIHFHSCGRVIDLFDDFKELGVTSLWPQLPVYDMRELADALRFYDFSLAIHTDRAFTMTHGRPTDVKELVLLENEIFKPKDGKAWFYIEVDTGFPFENIRQLVETVFAL